MATKFARVTIVLTMVYFAMLLLYSALDYKYRLTGVDTLLLYFIAPAILLGIFGFTLSLRRETQISVAIGTLSTAISLFSVEAFFTWQAEDRPASKAQAAESRGIQFDRRSKYDVFLELRAAGVNAFPSLGPQFLLKRQAYLDLHGRQVLPLAGVSNVTTIFCNESGSYVFFESDEHGFNNPKGLYDSGMTQIAAVGDSYTQGFCVDSERNAVSLIRRVYRNTLNFGVAGNGPLSMLATLKEYVAPLEPRIVLWLYYAGNDLRELDVEKRSHALLSYLKGSPASNLRFYQDTIDKHLAELVETQARNMQAATEENKARSIKEIVKSKTIGRILLLSQLRKTVRNLSGLTLTKKENFDLDLYSTILAEARRTVQVWGGTLYFIYLPSWSEFSRPYDFKVRRDGVMSIARSNGTPIIDMYEVFSKEDPPDLYVFRMPGHYNEAGYRLVAQTILEAIQEDGAGVRNSGMSHGPGG